MRSFPNYRIPTIIGWLLPPLLSFLITRELPFHIVFKIILFPILAVLLLFGEVLLAMKICGIWNSWQSEEKRKPSKKNKR